MKINEIHISIFLILFLAFFFLIPKYSYCSYKLEGIENFPDSYKPYLLELKKAYPNFHFTALYTGLNWKDVIDNENLFGVSLVPKSYSDSWKNIKPSEYNVEVDAGWVDASRQAVEYCMDPRNFLYKERLFQFETLSYDEKSNNLDTIEKILYGTELYNRVVEYKNGLGVNIVTDKKYSELILKAAAESRVSGYHLASRIKQEIGPFLSHLSISGTVAGYEGLYNFYNIGATSHADPLQVIKNGLEYAKDGKGASAQIREKYIIPWNTKEKSITGGGIFIGASYINVGQNTIYLQKFDVNNERSNILYWHQYMTNILAPYSESKIIYNGYLNSGILNHPMSFVIPVYNNMPEFPKESPAISKNDFTDDDSRVYANVSTVLNIRTGPGSSYEVLTTVTSAETMTRIKKGRQSGELWDKVLLENGMVGYAFQTYLLEVLDTDYEFPGIIFKAPLKINGNEITGLDYLDTSVKNMRAKISTEFTLDIYNYKEELINENARIGTGSKLVFRDDDNIVSEYNVILYGDANGDGKINSIDLLTIQRHILKLQMLKGPFLKGANTLKDGKSPTSIDLLRIQRHILKLEKLAQW